MSAALDCGHPPSDHSSFTTGYGTDSEGKRHCYACCADRDRADMAETGRATLYLTYERNEISPRGCGKVTNWPGSLSLTCSVRIGRHNIAGRRYDVWFTFNGQPWHGVQYGDNTQICHCRRVKK